MYARILSTILLAGTFLLGAQASTVKAGLPADDGVRYTMRETPEDPESDIVFTAELALKAIDSDGDSIGWKITTMEFRQPATTTEPEYIWVEGAPSVPSPDGLWWIDHADHHSPDLAEFVLSPALTGTAIADDPSDPTSTRRGPLYTRVEETDSAAADDRA